MTARAAKFADMEADFLFCRAWQHGWDPVEAEVMRGLGILKVTLRCLKCPVGKIQYLSRYNGDQVKQPEYTYPDKYLIEDVKGKWGGRKVFNSNVRLEAVRRLRGGRR